MMLSAVMFSFSSCIKKTTEAELEAAEQAKIDDYLEANPTLAFEKKQSGLYYLQIQPGTGPIAKTHDTAYVKYTGKFLNGNVFDTNVGLSDTLVYPVNNDPQLMIEGFEEGVMYLNQGAKAVLLLPSKLGYGRYGWYIIGGYTPLLYDIELVKLVPGPSK
jgi:FKBP-type peptidyl-prolyl cis-trans isomerase FkpA